MGTVKLIECPRDAWQGLPELIPTEYKTEYLKELIAAGFKHIDAVSFVSPKHV
jgi:hydroxymethylglutaryl-CoA lyase